MSDHGAGSAAESLRDFDTPVARWHAEIEKAEKEYSPWWKQARGIVARYRDERAASWGLGYNGGAEGKMNLLWSNVQTLGPAVYAATPAPVVQRRYGDQDDVGRVACTILQRAVSVQLDLGDFDQVAKECVLDNLLAGRGTVWIRYEPRFTSASTTSPAPALPPPPAPPPPAALAPAPAMVPPAMANGSPPVPGGPAAPPAAPPAPGAAGGPPPMMSPGSAAPSPPLPPPPAPPVSGAPGMPAAPMPPGGPPGAPPAPGTPPFGVAAPPAPPPPPDPSMPPMPGPIPIGSMLDDAGGLATGGIPADGGISVTDDGTMGADETVAWEEVPIDHVAFEDWFTNAARTWAEVRWCGRRVYMTRDEMKKRFKGAFIDDIPLTWHPSGLTEEEVMQPVNQVFARAQVFEIWDKPSRKVVWVAKGYTERLLDEVDDPLHLEGFFPTPRPLYATMTPDTLVPVPDYHLYRDQATEIDEMTARIHAISKAIKVAGVYDASADGVQRMFNEGAENQLIPINQWMAFANKGGLKGALDMLDVSTYAEVLEKLVQIRAQAKEDLYEVTGISDIIRGTTAASETATAQQIKSQFGTMRLRARQSEVARFCRDIVRIVAEVIAEHFTARTLIAVSGIANQPDELPFVAGAIALLKDEKTRPLRIDIETDSTILADQQQEQQSRTAFVQMAGEFLQQAAPAVQQTPAIAPLLGKMILFAIRAYPAASELEKAFEDAVAQLEAAAKQGQLQPSAAPDPKMLVAQAQVENIHSQIADRAHDNQLADAESGLKQRTEAAKVGLSEQAQRDKQQRDTVTMFHDHAQSRADTFLDAVKVASATQKAREKGAA